MRAACERASALRRSAGQLRGVGGAQSDAGLVRPRRLPQVRKTAVREVKVLRALRHDNIVSLLDVFRQGGKLYLVFEYVERTGGIEG